MSSEWDYPMERALARLAELDSPDWDTIEMNGKTIDYHVGGTREDGVVYLYADDGSYDHGPARLSPEGARRLALWLMGGQQ